MVADMQRARMLAWELPSVGWNVEILTPRASEVRRDLVELHNAAFFPPRCPVHEVGSLCRGLFEALGSRTHAWRTLLPMSRAGDRLLRSGRFDLVFFSTATFVYFALGSRWKQRFNIPYVLDFHDPWVQDGVRRSVGNRGVRSRVMDVLSRRMEHRAVVNADGLVSVSPMYLGPLRARYSHENPTWFDSKRNAVIPFGALISDQVEAAKTANTSTRHSDTELRIRYVGAGGPIMVRSFTLVCRGLAALRARGNPLVNRARIELFGTIYGWQPGDIKHLEQVAQQIGVGDIVREEPSRVSYRRSLELVLESDGLLILGVDDEGYMPSKLFSYALSGKPLLASLHAASPAHAHLEKTPLLGSLLSFGNAEIALDDATEIIARFLHQVADGVTIERREILEPFLAPAMARRHAQLFAECLSRTAGKNA